jgi:hypothetical protein
MASNTIFVKGNKIRKEALAGVAINPGYLVELQSDGTLDPHDTAATNATPTIAVENEVFGDDRTVAYAIGDNVLYEYMSPGSEVYLVLAAAAVAVVVGDFLESAGDGTVRKLTARAATAESATRSIVAKAIEAVDNSGGGGEVYILAEIM